MKKCSRCQCLNEDGAKFCRICGYAFSDRPWWKEIGMMPVRDFRMKNNLMLQLLYWILFVLCGYPLAMFTVIGIDYFVFNDYMSYSEQNILFAMLFILLVIIGIMMFLRYFCRNRLRRKRKELLDNDFIERKATKMRFSIFVRGGRNNYRFGLFDTKKVRVVLFPEYEELSWDEDCVMLKAKKEGKRFLIDVKGNAYEM